MLYNILPPLIFFGSLGGFIALLSRIMHRIHKTKVNHAMTQTALSEKKDSIVETLAPSQEQFQLSASRLSVWRGEAQSLWGNFQGWLVDKFKKGISRPSFSPRGIGKTVANTGKTVASSSRSLFHRLGATISHVRSRMPAGRQKVGSALPEWQSAKESVSEAIDKARVVRTPRKQAAAPVASAKPVIKTRTVKEKMAVVPALIFHKHNTATISELKKAYEALEEAQYNQAENILVPYIVKHSRDVAAYVLLGRVALAKQNWDEAVEIFEQVVALNPKEPGAQASLGFAAYRAGKLSKSLQALQRACEEDPHNKEVLKHLLLLARRMDNRGLQHSIQEKLETLPETVVPKA